MSLLDRSFALPYHFFFYCDGPAIGALETCIWRVSYVNDSRAIQPYLVPARTDRQTLPTLQNVPADDSFPCSTIQLPTVSYLTDTYTVVTVRCNIRLKPLPLDKSCVSYLLEATRTRQKEHSDGAHQLQHKARTHLPS